MNNTVENDSCGFPKVKWLQYTGEAGVQVNKLLISNFLRIKHSKNHQNRIILTELFKN